MLAPFIKQGAKGTPAGVSQYSAPAPILPANGAVPSSSGTGDNLFVSFSSGSVELGQTRVLGHWRRPR